MYVVEINNENFGQLIRAMQTSTAPPKTVSGIPNDPDSDEEKTGETYYAIRDAGRDKKYEVV